MQTEPSPAVTPTVSPDTPHFLTLPQAAALLGQGGRRPSIPTLWRWCRHGCRGVRLAYLRLGRELRITPQALQDFGVALAARDREVKPPAPSVFPLRPSKSTPARREKEIAAAEARLAARGLSVGGGES